MANQITDNRTLISANNTNANIDDATGAATGNTNTETFVEGTGSVSIKLSSASGAMLYDFGSAQNFANNTFYTWWAVSTAGKLNTRANGGVRIRFAGATVTDFFEIYVAGSDTYTGGFTMSVIDIERAYTAAVTNGDANTGTGGTPPATSAIRYVGVFFDITAMISGNVDNCFLDAMWRLPQNTPGIIVEGRNGGTTDWTFQDIFIAGDPGDTTKAWGTGFQESNGSLTFNTPIQIGINDTTTHGFSDTNALIGWQDQFVDLANFYNITLLGNAGGTTNFTLGNVSGTGNDRVGSQGGVIFAKSDGARWSLDADDPNIDSCNIYGTTLIHAEDFQIDDAACTFVNAVFLDCTSATITGGEILNCSVIDSNTADGVAFITTADLADVIKTNFIFSDGHAIELTATGTYTFTGNTFTGSWGGTAGSNLVSSSGSTDAMIYNNSGGAVTINITDGDNVSVRNGASATTTVNISVPLEVSGVTEGTRVSIIGNGGAEDGVEILAGYASNTGVLSGSFSGTTPQNVFIRARNSGIINALIQDDGGVFTDYTDEAREQVGANDVILLPATPAVSDAAYFGGLATFGELLLNISTAGTTYVGTWEYWNGAWTSLSVTDNTSSLQTTGWNTVRFTPPNDWSTTTVNSQGPFFYIRFRVTTGGGTGGQAEYATLNRTTKYLPFDGTGTIASGTGLTTTAVWIEDTNAG